MADNTLQIKIGVNSSELDAGIKRSEREIRSYDKACKELDKTMQSLSGPDLDDAKTQRAEASLKKYTAAVKELQLVEERRTKLDKEGKSGSKTYEDLTRRATVLKSVISGLGKDLTSSFKEAGSDSAGKLFGKLEENIEKLRESFSPKKEVVDRYDDGKLEAYIQRLKEISALIKEQDELQKKIKSGEIGPGEGETVDSLLKSSKERKEQLQQEFDAIGKPIAQDLGIKGKISDLNEFKNKATEAFKTYKNGAGMLERELNAQESVESSFTQILKDNLPEASLKTLDRQIEEATTSYRELSAAAESLDGDDKVRATEAAFEQLQQAIELTKEKINQLEGELSTMDSSSPEFAAKQKELFSAKGSLANLEGALDPKPVSRYSGVLGKMSEGLQSMGLSANAADVAMGNLASKGMQLAAEAARAVVRAFTEAIKLTAEFDHTMSAVQAFSGGSAADLKELEATALELGATTRYTANQVADSMTILAKAGWKNEDITAGMKGILDTTTASGESIETVSAAIVQSLNAFGASAEESSKYGDVLTKSALSAYLSIEEIAESMKYVGPVAKTFGSDIAEVNTVLVALAKNGIAGGQAGTMMRSFMLRLANDTNNARSTIESLGVEVMDSFGNFNSITSILDQLRAKVSGLSAAEQARIAKVAAGERGSSGLLALLNMEQKEYDEIYSTIENSIGSTTEAADIMQDNLQGDFEILRSRVQDLGIDIGHALNPALRGLTQFATDAVDAVDSIFGGNSTRVLKNAEALSEEIEDSIASMNKLSIEAEFPELSKEYLKIQNEVNTIRDNLGKDWESLSPDQQGLITKAIQDLSEKFPALKGYIDEATGAVNLQAESWETALSGAEDYYEYIIKQAKTSALEQGLEDLAGKELASQINADAASITIKNADNVKNSKNIKEYFSSLYEFMNGLTNEEDITKAYKSFEDSISSVFFDLQNSGLLSGDVYKLFQQLAANIGDMDPQLVLNAFNTLLENTFKDGFVDSSKIDEIVSAFELAGFDFGNETGEAFVLNVAKGLMGSEGSAQALSASLMAMTQGDIVTNIKKDAEKALKTYEQEQAAIDNQKKIWEQKLEAQNKEVAADASYKKAQAYVADLLASGENGKIKRYNGSQELGIFDKNYLKELEKETGATEEQITEDFINFWDGTLEKIEDIENDKRLQGPEHEKERLAAIDAVYDEAATKLQHTTKNQALGFREDAEASKGLRAELVSLAEGNKNAADSVGDLSEEEDKLKEATQELDDALKTVNDNFSREQGAKEWAKGIGDALDEVDQKVEDYKKNIESNWQSFEYGGGEFKENKYGEDNYVTIEKNIENFTKRNDKMEKMLNYYNDGKLADMMAKGQDLLVQQIVKAIEAGDFDALEEVYENQTNTLNMQGEEYAEKMESTLEEQYERQKKLAELAARLAIQFSQEDLSSVLSSNLSVDQAENYKNQIETIATNLKEGIGELGSQTLDEGQLNQAYAWIDAMQRLGYDLSDATKELLNNTELQASDPGAWLTQLLDSLSTDYQVGIEELRKVIAEHTAELAPEIQEELNNLLDPTKPLSLENAEKAKELLLSSLDDLYNIVEGENGELTFTPKMVVDGVTPDPEAPQKGTEAAKSAKTDVQDAIDNNPKEVDTELKNNVTVNDGDVEDNTGDNTATDVTKIVNVKEVPIISNKDAVDEKVKEAAGNSVKVDKTVELYLKPLVRSTGSVDSTAAMKASETVKTTKTVNQDVEKNVTVNTSIKTNITGDKGNEVGSKFGREIASGIQSQAGAISGAASSVMNGAAASAGAMSAAGYNAGSNWSAGMLAGILSREGQIAAAATRIANTVKNATAAAHDSHSPSRVAEQYGIWWDQGLAIGLDKGTQDVIAANDRVTKALIDATSSADASYTAAQAFASGFANSLSTELEKEISKNKQSAIDSITTSFESNKDSKARAKAALKHSSTVKRGSKEFDDAVKKEADDWEKLASEKQKAIDKKQTELDKKGKKKAKGKKKKKLQNEIKELEKEQQVYLNNAYIAAQEEARIQAERDRIDSKLDLVDTNATLRENKLIEQNSGKELTMQQKLQLASEKRAEAQRVLNEVNANDAATTEQKIDAYNKYIDAVKGATEAEQERLETLIGMASANAASTKTSLTISHKGGPLAAAEELLVAQNQVKKALEAQNVVNKSTYATDELRQKAADETAKAYTEQYNAIRKVNQEIIESAGKKIEKWRIETEYAQKSALKGSQQIQKAQLELNALQESYQKLLKQSNATEEEKLEMMDKITQATEALHGSYKDLYKDMLGGMSIDKPFTAAEVRINETIENMESHITGLTDLMEARAAVVERGLSDLALSYLNSLSPEEAANYYIELQNASDQEFNKFNKTLTELALKNKEYSDIQQQTEDVIADRVTNIAQTLYNISTAGIPINAYTAGLNNAGVSLQSSNLNTTAIEQGMSSIITALMGMSKKFDDASGELVSSLDDFSRDITTAFGKVGISIDGREFGRIIRQYV